MTNYEKHPTRKGCYIAYDAEGLAFRVQRTARGWYAAPSHIAGRYDARRFGGSTLEHVALQISRDLWNRS